MKRRAAAVARTNSCLNGVGTICNGYEKIVTVSSLAEPSSSGVVVAQQWPTTANCIKSLVLTDAAINTATPLVSSYHDSRLVAQFRVRSPAVTVTVAATT